MVSSFATEAVERVLLVDDEQALCLFLKEELEDEGYYVSVAHTSATAWDALSDCGWLDLIILDWTLPDGSGPELCQRMRDAGIIVPVIMLTGHAEVSDRVLALDAGVDDYLIKPFSIDELMARLRAMHRRAETFSGPVNGSEVNELLQVADLSMNTRTRDVSRGDRPIRLSVKEYDLLNFLMRGAGRVLERQEIMHGVWGENFYGDDNLLDVYIRYLRQKVELDDAPALIHTVRGVGFILREQQS